VLSAVPLVLSLALQIRMWVLNSCLLDPSMRLDGSAFLFSIREPCSECSPNRPFLQTAPVVPTTLVWVGVVLHTIVRPSQAPSPAGRSNLRWPPKLAGEQ